MLVNGVHTDEFDICRGLLQGDPLSPFLFIISMEGLHDVIQKAVTLKLVNGVKIGNDDLPLSHLMYADDVIFFGDWNLQNASNLIGISQFFYVMSGLNINVSKSKIIGVGVAAKEAEEMASILGCGVVTIPFKDLGV